MSPNLVTPDAEQQRRAIARFRRLIVVMSGGFGVLLGVIALGAIPALANTRGTSGELLLWFGALFLMGCAVFGWVLFRPFVDLAAKTVELSAEGISAELHRGSPVRVEWTDPRFNAELTASTAYPTTSVYLKVRAGHQKFSARISREGASSLRDLAAAQGLSVVTGPQPGSAKWVEVTRITPR